MRPDFSGRDAAANEADGDENTVSGAQPHPGRHLLDGTVWVLLAEALLPVTGLVTAAFLTRRLGPNGYGLWVLAVSLVVWVEWSLASFFSRATIKHVGEARDWRPLGTAAVQLQFRMGSGAMVAIWILALPLARWLNEPSLATCLALLAVDIPLFALAQAHRQILAGREEARFPGTAPLSLLDRLNPVEMPAHRRRGLASPGLELIHIASGLIALQACQRLLVRHDLLRAIKPVELRAARPAKRIEVLLLLRRKRGVGNDRGRSAPGGSKARRRLRARARRSSPDAPRYRPAVRSMKSTITLDTRVSSVPSDSNCDEWL